MDLRRDRWRGCFRSDCSLSVVIPRATRRSRALRRSTKSIAVLPFANLSHDPENVYFAAGIQDEIITRLAKIADLKVISCTSTHRFKSSPDDIPAIAGQLGVATVPRTESEQGSRLFQSSHRRRSEIRAGLRRPGRFLPVNAALWRWRSARLLSEG